MKTVIATLKAQIEEAKKDAKFFSEESERLFEQAFSSFSSKGGKEIYQMAEASRKSEIEAEHKLRCFRQSLAYLLDAQHISYDTFKPEESC